MRGTDVSIPTEYISPNLNMRRTTQLLPWMDPQAVAWDYRQLSLRHRCSRDPIVPQIYRNSLPITISHSRPGRPVKPETQDPDHGLGNHHTTHTTVGTSKVI